LVELGDIEGLALANVLDQAKEVMQKVGSREELGAEKSVTE